MCYKLKRTFLKSKLDQFFSKIGTFRPFFSLQNPQSFEYAPVNGGKSEGYLLEHGIPQSSCLGPLLFTLYTPPIRRHHIVSTRNVLHWWHTLQFVYTDLFSLRKLCILFDNKSCALGSRICKKCQLHHTWCFGCKPIHNLRIHKMNVLSDTQLNQIIHSFVLDSGHCGFPS